MSVDTTTVGVLVADLVESMAAEYAKDDVRIGTVAVVVEVEGENWTWVRYRCSDPRGWVQEGFFQAAAAAVRYTRASSQGES